MHTQISCSMITTLKALSSFYRLNASTNSVLFFSIIKTSVILKGIFQNVIDKRYFFYFSVVTTSSLISFARIISSSFLSAVKINLTSIFFFTFFIILEKPLTLFFYLKNKTDKKPLELAFYVLILISYAISIILTNMVSEYFFISCLLIDLIFLTLITTNDTEDSKEMTKLEKPIKNKKQYLYQDKIDLHKKIESLIVAQYSTPIKNDILKETLISKLNDYVKEGTLLYDLLNMYKENVSILTPDGQVKLLAWMNKILIIEKGQTEKLINRDHDISNAENLQLLTKRISLIKTRQSIKNFLLKIKKKINQIELIINKEDLERSLIYSLSEVQEKIIKSIHVLIEKNNEEEKQELKNSLMKLKKSKLLEIEVQDRIEKLKDSLVELKTIETCTCEQNITSEYLKSVTEKSVYQIESIISQLQKISFSEEKEIITEEIQKILEHCKYIISQVYKIQETASSFATQFSSCIAEIENMTSIEIHKIRCIISNCTDFIECFGENSCKNIKPTIKSLEETLYAMNHETDVLYSEMINNQILQEYEIRKINAFTASDMQMSGDMIYDILSNAEKAIGKNIDCLKKYIFLKHTLVEKLQAILPKIYSDNESNAFIKAFTEIYIDSPSPYIV